LVRIVLYLYQAALPLPPGRQVIALFRQLARWHTTSTLFARRTGLRLRVRPSPGATLIP
jgi:hypothetical protein